MTDDTLDFNVRHTATPADLLSGSGRLERLTWLTELVRKGNPLFFMQDGERSRLVFQEAADSYINGQFLAAISLGFCFIERTIAGRLWFVDSQRYGRLKSFELFNEAKQRSWINEHEHIELNKLREVRNYVTHFRPPPSEKDAVRYIFSDNPKPADFEKSAKTTIEVAVSVLHQTAL